MVANVEKNLPTGKGPFGAVPSESSTTSSPSRTSFREGEDYCITTDDGCLCCAKVPIRVGLKNRRLRHTRSCRKNPRSFVCSSHDHSVWLERDKTRSSVNRRASARLLPRGRICRRGS